MEEADKAAGGGKSLTAIASGPDPSAFGSHFSFKPGSFLNLWDDPPELLNHIIECDACVTCASAFNGIDIEKELQANKARAKLPNSNFVLIFDSGSNVCVSNFDFAKEHCTDIKEVVGNQGGVGGIKKGARPTGA